MAHALTTYFGTPARYSWLREPADDPLDAMRGIIGCTLMSVLVFWLPLAFLLTR